MKSSWVPLGKYSNLRCTPQDLEAGGYDVKTACQLFETQASQLPKQTALLYKDENVSYEHLNQKANQLARYIRKQYQSVAGKSLAANTLIPISLERSTDFVIGILAILKAGGAYVPINPGYPDHRIQHILNEIDARIIITEAHLVDKYKQFSAGIRTLSLEDGFENEGSSNLSLPLTANDLAYVIYTSGSSGAPKGVMASHATLISQTVCASYFYADTSDTVAFFSDVSFDSTTTEIWGALLNGARLYIPDNFFELLSQPKLFKATVLEKKLSVILLTRALFDLLYSLDETVYESVNFMMVGGEALTKHIMLKLVRSRYKPNVLINAYGPTENSTFCTTYTINQDFSRYSSVPIGRPYSNRVGLVLDKHLQLLPIGITGELFVSGTSLSKGYLKKPEITQEKFITNPYFNESGENYGKLYKTNDLVRWLPEGNLEYIGRNDFMVKLRGYRIELGEIETRMAELPQVSHSVVTMEKNDSLSYLVGYYVAPQPINESSFRRELAKTLPDYMIPNVFVYLQTLPVTTNGKLDRKALPKINYVKATSPQISSLGSHSVEQTIAEIWSKTLNVKQIDPSQSFFNLGGNSLAAMLVRSELEEAFSIKMNIVDLFQFPTINSLTDRVNSLRREAGIVVEDEIFLEKGVSKLENNQPYDEPIAIIGMACRLPEINNPEEFWQLLYQGKTNLREFSEEELTAYYDRYADSQSQNDVNRGAVFKDPFLFDAGFFGYSVKDAEFIDPQHRQFLECAWEALEHSGNIPENYSGDIAVFASQGRNTYFNQHVYPAVVNDPKLFQAILGNGNDFLSTRVSYKLNLTGPSITNQTACSSSLVSIQLACDNLKLRHCDMALVGGVSLFYNYGYTYQDDLIESPDGFCRAFDANAQGTVITSGLGVVVLKRLSDAIADKDRIYAVIKGGAVNNDGASKMAFTAPSVDGQVKVIRKALLNANVSPNTISYIESHGTGTKLGDPIEWTALHNVYQQYSDGKASCTIGALKPNIGHTDSAAGVLGLIKVCLALYHKWQPATLNFNSLNPEIASFNKLFSVSNVGSEWKTNGQKRRAAISSFGLGGTNAHIILEEYQSKSPSFQNLVKPFYLIPFSAKNAESLQNMAQNYRSFLQSLEMSNVADVAFTAQQGRAEFKERGFFIISSEIKTDILAYFPENEPASACWYFLAYYELMDQLIKQFIEHCQKQMIRWSSLNSWLNVLEVYRLQLVGVLWSNEIVMNWRAIQCYPNTVRKISIPTYPYNQKHYQLPKHAPVSTKDISQTEQEQQVEQTIDNQLRGLWEEVLGINAKEIVPSSDFLELGGDSLSYIDLLNLLKKRISSNILLEELIDIFDFGSMCEFINSKVVEGDAV